MTDEGRAPPASQDRAASPTGLSPEDGSSQSGIPGAGELLQRLDGQWRHLGDLGLRWGARFWIKPAQLLRERGLAESKLFDQSRGLSWRLTETGQALARRRT